MKSANEEIEIKHLKQVLNFLFGGEIKRGNVCNILHLSDNQSAFA